MKNSTSLQKVLALDAALQACRGLLLDELTLNLKDHVNFLITWESAGRMKDFQKQQRASVKLLLASV